MARIAFLFPGQGAQHIGMGQQIAEAYPALKSQALFLKLQKQLAETEDRIALARNYFNDIATFYNTRLGIFPDGMLAGLMGMRVQPLMNEAGFVRAPMLMKTPGSDTAGPCPKCQADVRSREGIKFCPFCGSRTAAPSRTSDAALRVW